MIWQNYPVQWLAIVLENFVATALPSNIPTFIFQLFYNVSNFHYAELFGEFKLYSATGTDTVKQLPLPKVLSTFMWPLCTTITVFT